MMPFSPYEVRRARPDESAAIFVAHAAITSADAGDLLEWTHDLETRLESGTHAWVVARGRRLAGYATVDPVPGLPGVNDLAGGIVPARRRQGLGTQLLQHVQAAAVESGVRQLSCCVESLEDEAATFLLDRGFFMEHEECLLELTDLDQLPPLPAGQAGEIVTFPRAHAVAEFRRIYDESFAGMPWSQPYSEAEVAALLSQPEDLLFLTLQEKPIGVVWHEVRPDGRGQVEPLGIGRAYQGSGYGRALLSAALHSLSQRGASLIEIGVWRQNTVAMNLYKSLGFVEAANWYYLACELDARHSTA